VIHQIIAPIRAKKFIIASTILISFFLLHTTVTCMWTGGISGRNRVRHAGKWAKGL